MRRTLMLFAVSASFLGCAPTHTLKEVIHDPSLLMPAETLSNASSDTPSDNPLVRADQWFRKVLW